MCHFIFSISYPPRQLTHVRDDNFKFGEPDGDIFEQQGIRQRNPEFRSETLLRIRPALLARLRYFAPWNEVENSAVALWPMSQPLLSGARSAKKLTAAPV